VAQRLTAKDAYLEGKLSLPPGYGLEHGADVLLLRRADGSVAATFSAKGAAPAEVARTAEGDHRGTTRGPPGSAPSEMRRQGQAVPRVRRGRIGRQRG
jgi:hypothetical protein